MDIVGTIYRGALTELPKVWLVAVWLTDLHIEWHPLNAEDEAAGDGEDEAEQPNEIPSEEMGDSSRPPPADSAEASGAEEIEGEA